MPIIKSAKKKMRQDKKRTKRNRVVSRQLKNAVKKVKKTPNKKTIAQAYSAIDTAAKKSILHKNKANRLKASIAKKTKK